MLNLLIAATVSYQITSGLPLKHDGCVVERPGSGEKVEFVVKAGTKRAFLYANYESNRWMKAESYPFVRDPHFRMRALNVSRTGRTCAQSRSSSDTPTSALRRSIRTSTRIVLANSTEDSIRERSAGRTKERRDVPSRRKNKANGHPTDGIQRAMFKIHCL